MSVFDIVILIFVVFGMWKGFTAGLTQSIISLVGWLAAFILGTMFAELVAPYYVTVIDSHILQLALGFLTIVLIVIVILHMVAYILHSFLRTLKLSLLDKIAGGVLGAGRNVLIVLIVLSISAPLFSKVPTWQNSVLVPELLEYAPVAKEMMLEAFAEASQQLDDKSNKLDEKVNELDEKTNIPIESDSLNTAQ